MPEEFSVDLPVVVTLVGGGVPVKDRITVSDQQHGKAHVSQ